MTTKITRFYYDYYGRISLKVIYFRGSSPIANFYYYDTKGRVSNRVDVHESNVSYNEYEYDDNDRTIKWKLKVDGGKGIVEYRYDTFGNQTERIDENADGSIWKFVKYVYQYYN